MRAKTPCKSKSVVVHLFDIRELGYCLTLNDVVVFSRHGNSKNISMSSILRTCRKSVSIGHVIEGVFV